MLNSSSKGLKRNSVLLKLPVNSFVEFTLTLRYIRLSDECLRKAVSEMSNNNANSHLTLEERRIILTGITNGSTKSAIAQTIGKDNSTIGKEIKLHRTLKHKCKMPLECTAYKACPHGRNCTPDCPEYIPFKCSRRDRTPGTCNGCSNWSYCRFDKYVYDPEDAQHEYRMTLIESREGVDIAVIL